MALNRVATSRPETMASTAGSSQTDLHTNEKDLTELLETSHREIPSIAKLAPSVDKEAETTEEDWEDDPINPRNWPLGRKWGTVAIVRSASPRFRFSASWRILWLVTDHLDHDQVSLYTFVSPLASSMMAPGLPEVAHIYKITSPTVIALTLSIFLLAFAIGVGPYQNV